MKRPNLTTVPALALAVAMLGAVSARTEAGFLRVVPGEYTIVEGEPTSIDFAIELVADTPVVDFFGIEATIELDPAVFSVALSSLYKDDFLNSNGSDFTGINSVTTANGMLYVDFNQSATFEGASVLSGTQRIFGFTAVVLPDAPIGEHLVNLLGYVSAAYQTLITDVNGDTIPFSAGFEPTNGFDPGIDAVVIVPEPTSIALVGLGGALLAFGVRRRLR